MGVFLSVCVRVIKKLLILLQQLFLRIRSSIVVSISACHAEDPGSIPGRGATCTHPSKQWGFIGYQARAKKMRAYVSGFARRAPVFKVGPPASDSDRRAIGTCRVGWVTPCTGLSLPVVVAAGSSGSCSSDGPQAPTGAKSVGHTPRRSQAKFKPKRGDPDSKSAVV